MAVCATAVRARVGIVFASVAYFASGHDTVATCCFGAVAIASTAIGIGSIVTLFKASSDANAASG